MSLILGLAVVSKVVQWHRWQRDIAGLLRVGARWVFAAAFAVAFAETTVAISQVSGVTRWWGAVATVMLTGSFIASTLISMRSGVPQECACFGGLGGSHLGLATLARQGVLLAAGMVVLVNREHVQFVTHLDWWLVGIFAVFSTVNVESALDLSIKRLA